METQERQAEKHGFTQEQPNKSQLSGMAQTHIQKHGFLGNGIQKSIPSQQHK